MKSTRVFFGVATALATVVSLGVLTTAQNTVMRTLPGPDSSNYRPLEQINKSNVSQLQLAWSYPYGNPIFSPIYARDTIYGFGRNGSLIALDATTGKEIWIHENLNGINSKGINYWESEDGNDRRLIFSVQSFLQEIDARTGKTIPTFGVDGIVDMRKGLLRAEGTSISVQPASPGRIWRNTIVFGGQAGESIMTPPGDIRAYDVLTGKLLWQFNTIPQPGQFGYETNPPDGWKYIGGANNWGEMALDEERGIVYIPTGSATADFWGGDRHGQNLYANCILALDVRTGKRLWHFQTIHHDLWDLDNVSAPQLVTVTHNGQKVDVVAHAGKTGFLYVFNRVTGEPLWPIEERPVGKFETPNELSWPTQPFPTKPPAFGVQKFTADDINPHLLTKQEYDALKARMAVAINGTGPQGGLFNPTAIGKDSVSMPGNQGGSNWGTTAAYPERGMVFVTNVNQVALLVINDVKNPPAPRGGGAGGNQQAGGTVLSAGLAAYQKYCLACHGANQAGVPGAIPALVGVSDRMDIEAFRTVIKEGRNNMRPILDATNEEIAAMYAWFQTTNPAGRGGSNAARGGGPGVTFPTGPVVASGGAPRPALPPRYGGPFYPGTGGTAGNMPWPEDVAAHGLPTRYQSGYNVMGSSTKPPYTTITAYDLNTGTIKWQVPNGDDPQTVAMTTEVPGQPCRAAGGCVPGGVRNTGGLGARYGMVVTKGGLLFQLSKDGFARAYDIENGNVLWKGPVAGFERGIPVVYESKGREYVLFMSPAAQAPAGQLVGRGGAGAPAPLPPAPTGPYGYMVFALPAR
jgi:quinoprotein glucose dehydrogenase